MKIIQPRQIETATRGDIMAIKVPKELRMMAEEDWHFFLDLKQIKALKIKTLDLKTLMSHTELRQYLYFSGNIEEVLGHHRSTADEDAQFWNTVYAESKTSSLEVLQDPSFDTKKLFYYWSYAGLWYSFRGETPLSPTYYIGYIGGVANDRYDLDKAEKILKKNKWVSNIERIDIPYYNRQRGHDKAIEFYVRLPQEEHNKLVKHWRDEKKVEFWTCRVKESLASPYGLEPFDVLGLKTALKPKEHTEDTDAEED